MLVTQIRLEHVESFHECLDTVAKENRFLAQTEALPLEIITSFVKDSIENDAIQYVALVNNQVVGWADIFPHWASTLAHRGNLGMGVHPAYRGQGIGEQRLRTCLKKARSKGISRIELETRADNFPSINLYKKLGFVTEVTKKNAMKFNETFFDSIQMSLIFE
ncbi:GNAT family N-acetyltransferase [Photobacterium sp. CCB-ST2H9]|uniref:GNAT family N-acetyltransferase n=1 Tax=Photobacterium sp. CCB-ST2H9 TaxID=2912855 RepID=UPI0020038FCA|nr:GNAT family N-acetyltransferase [Photobacterium sp. CCB-ST2H9]UTM60028.1 GNAT family N-acetyltransferase [Photobacterium sp. CCB-ST2H9]